MVANPDDSLIALAEEIAEQENESVELVLITLDIQQKIKRRGIEGIHFMDKAERRMEAEKRRTTKEHVEREMKKRL